MEFAQIIMALLEPDSVMLGKTTIAAAKKTAAARMKLVLILFLFM